MRNTNYLNHNEAVLLGTIIEEKNNPGKTTLRNIRPRILVAYHQYLNNFSSLESKPKSILGKLETAEKSALQLCYSSATKSFEFIRGRIFSIQCDQLKAFCPYCLLDKPRTLDHYIPKEEFPEYSTFIKNLIPCCYDCNQRKGQIWRVNRKRRFIHFYNDLFIQERFLFANLIYRRGNGIPQVTYRLSKPPTITNAEFSIVKMHFKDLDLLHQYNTRSNALLSSEITTLKSSLVRGNSKAEIVDHLMEKSRSLTVDFGANYWSAIMYETIAITKKMIRSL